MAASNVTTDEILSADSSHISNTLEKKLENFNDSDTIEINLETRCRGCFTEDPEMHYLFNVIDQKLSLAHILSQTTSYLVNENDGFPPYLCAKCTACLVDFYNFKLQFEKTDVYIRTLLGRTAFIPQTVKQIIYGPQKDSGCVDFKNIYEETVDLYNSNIKEIKGQIEPFCNACNLKFENADTHDTHMAKEHGKNPFEKYAMFRKMFQTKRKLKTETEKKLKCEKSDLEKEKMFQMPGKFCRFCQKKFPEDEFQFHWELHKKHVCEYCGHKCIKKSDLDVHKQSVHGRERNYKCYVCNKSFKTKQLLNRHLIVHTNPRSFICHHCGDRFNDRSTLNTHIQLKHIRSRNFICSICGLAFPLKSTLEKHVLRHNKNRPPNFFCDVCNAGFKDNSSLKRHHLMKHSEDYEKPQCQFCKKRYCSKTKLRYHIDRHHSGIKYERKKRQNKKVEQSKAFEVTDEETNYSDDGDNDRVKHFELVSRYSYPSQQVRYFDHEKIDDIEDTDSDF